MCSPLKGFPLIVSIKAAIDKWRFRFLFRCMLCTVEIVSAVWCSPLRLSPRCMLHTAVCWKPRKDNFVIEYLDEIETEFKNSLACLSGAQMGSSYEKNWRSKISWHTHFKTSFVISYIMMCYLYSVTLLERLCVSVTNQKVCVYLLPIRKTVNICYQSLRLCVHYLLLVRKTGCTSICDQSERLWVSTTNYKDVSICYKS